MPCSRSTTEPRRTVRAGVPSFPSADFLAARFLAVVFDGMSEVSRILTAIGQGDPHAASQLLPLANEERRGLAAQRLAHEPPG